MQTSSNPSRREFLRLAAAATTGMALAACTPAALAPAQSGAGESGSAAPGETPITLTHWQHDSTARAAAVKQFKAAFEDAHPNVTIDFQSIPWAEYWGKLASGIAAGKGSAPDVFQIPMGLVEEYVDGGNLMPAADTVIAPEYIEENYLPWAVQRARRENQYYGLPLDVQTLLIYRNNALYAEAGLDPAEPFTDLNQLYEHALALTKKSGDVTDQIGCDTSYYSAWQTILYQQYLQREQGGKPWIDSSTNQLVFRDYPEIFDTFEWFLKLSADTDDSAFLTGQNRFALGKTGMVLNHPVSRGTYAKEAPDLEYTIVPFAPRSVSQELYTGGSHWLWVVGKWVVDNEIAWQWVASATNRDAQLIWSEVGGDLPSFKGLGDDPQFRTNPNDNVVMDSLNYATPWEWVGWAEWVKEFGDARDRVVVGGEDANTSFDLMIANLNEVIAAHSK